jgi:decaprenylphospho-beta-D-ribofuranose 2-oxidase
MNRTITNWGKYPERSVDWWAPTQAESLAQFPDSHGWIARGMGRCYGDSALADHVVSTLNLRHLLDFQPDTGLLTCEAGVTFDAILKVFVPKGFFLPVTPGTKFVTAGGALASDIHGKNHHVAGTFSDHVVWFDLQVADGRVLRCSRTENEQLFQLTCGGMGLTGLILRLAFYLKPIPTAYIRQKTLVARNLQEVMDLFEEHQSCTNSVAWIDCLQKGKNIGRSLLMLGEFATPDQLSKNQAKQPYAVHAPPKWTVPFDFPSFVLNSFSVKAFNFLFYHKQWAKETTQTLHYEPFYYPLDAIHHWNRIYGKKGFTQYQFVLPKAASREGLTEILSRIAQRNMGSFLSVLKLFGPQDPQYLRFPMEGYTLALDFKITPDLWAFLEELDQLVLAYGGRLYLTKDVRMSADFFYQTYPQIQDFKTALRAWDPQQKFSSEQSKRLGIHGE